MNEWQQKYNEYLMLMIEKDLAVTPLSFADWKKQFDEPAEEPILKAQRHNNEQAQKEYNDKFWDEVIKIQQETQERRKHYEHRQCPYCPRPVPMFYPNYFHTMCQEDLRAQ